MTRAWLFYLGLLFIVIVVHSPDGVAGLVARAAMRLRRHGWRACSGVALSDACAGLAWVLAVVLAVQYAYAMQSADEMGGQVVLFDSLAIDTTARIVSICVVVVVLALGLPWLWVPDWRAAVFGLAVAIALRFVLGRYFTRRLGGYTGDCLGFAQQIFELTLYLCSLAWISF